MRAALRSLCEKGAEALKPQKILKPSVQIESHIAQPAKQIWRSPIVSKRVANTIRKKALRDGTYGSFDTETGAGWEPGWDLVLKSSQYRVSRYGGILPPKKTSRERSREERAGELEEHLESRMEKIEEYYTEKEESRVQDMSFEAQYKRLLRSGSK
ncbi:unnamed protein product [Cylindrotheca closterium]|uniref:MRPL25 domain-containing protein n=1 Tax=Cylindrotheca closterium TaxID=2856 RepID=A0AAD2JI79_9STRA|nr:unnamed protein product [Cylindrotheca closterium]